MLLKRIDDPRDTLEKATRYELWKFALARGVNDIEQEMPADLMRKVLRARNVTDIHVHFPNLLHRKIGMQRGVNATPTVADAVVPAAQVDASDDLMRQWKEQKVRDAQPPGPPKTYNEMAELRKECRRRGIKLARTDKIGDLRAKLEVPN